MNIKQLQITIDRVVKKEGISRIPAFWMHYILSSIAKELSIKIESTIYITYFELLSLRDMGKLMPGQKYMITDYKTTTTQAFTKSANNVFNIIVEALDEYNLKEEAWVSRAYNDEGYFEKSNLSAWKIWYCLDNDKSRFGWADEKNGTGVIYRMIDEWGNDCPYDFKNIQFLRSKDWQNIHKDWFDVVGSDKFGDLYLYTFSAREYNIKLDEYGDFIDGSLKGPYKYRRDKKSITSTYHDNIIYPSLDLRDEGGYQILNDNVFMGYIDKRGTNTNVFINEYHAYCSYGNTINGLHNTFLMNCNRNNIIGDSNLFGNEFRDNDIVGGYNKFYNNCKLNKTGKFYNDNIHKEGFSNNTIGDICYSNSFGEGVTDNQFGNNFTGNTIGDSCKYNTFKTDTVNNVIGGGSVDNVFGSYFMNNEISSGSKENKFGGFCKDNKINGSGLIYEGFNSFIDSNCNVCTIKLGVGGKENNRINIDLEDRNFMVEVGIDSFGSCKIYNEIDLIN